MRCECGKRPLDIVMSHILKIMIEEGIVPEKATLRRNSPVPLSGFYYSSLNPQFIGKKTLILLHPDFTKAVASRLIDEVPEVKCVLKGSPQSTVGQLDKDSQISHFEILEGDDTQINVMRTLIQEKIVLVKRQSRHHIEVAVTTEDKLVRLHNYLNNNDIKRVEALKNNLEINGISDGYEIFNEAFEDLEFGDADLCVIDAFPGVDIEEIVKKAEKMAENVIVI